MYDGLYALVLHFNLDTTARYYPYLSVTDNANNNLEMGATGYLQTSDYESQCPEDTFINGDYYVETLPFTFAVPFTCAPQYTFITYVKGKYI